MGCNRIMTAPNLFPQLKSLLLVGVNGVEHCGYHFHAAAAGLSLPTSFCDIGEAYRGPWLWRKANWSLRGRRPARLSWFSAKVAELCRRQSPDMVLCTGLVPLDAAALRAIGEQGARRVNFLTDDPWNPAHRAPWFLEGLPLYDTVYSPRQANLESLRALGCRDVRYLPFAFAPQAHYPESISAEERRALGSDVIFAGGGDADRVPYVAALRQAGLQVALYGGYWDRFPETRNLSRGMASPELLRKAIRSARIALCLVRRANRDGHCMRTFEVPAVGGACMIAEDTAEHRAIFGPDGEAVRYFRDTAGMLETARRLLSAPEERERLAHAAHRLIVEGGHTYQHRLMTILEAAV
jgi:spore maturation protein CgeB